MKMQRRFFVVCAILTLAVSAAAQLRLPAVISDNMVLQQQTKAPVWGWAAPGSVVTIKTGWNSEPVKVKTNAGGKWRADIRTPSAGGPYALTVSDGDSTVKITDILVGEVWICSGQSNMAWPLNSAQDGPRYAAQADYPKIRLLTVPRQASETPLGDVKADWQVCSPQTARSFSAVGYFFGLEIFKMLDVPIGLINSSW